MKAIAEYFRDLAADDRYFGAEPPTPDADMLQRIAEREIRRRVDAHVDGEKVVLRADAGADTAPEPTALRAPEPTPEPAPEPQAPAAPAPVAAEPEVEPAPQPAPLAEPEPEPELHAEPEAPAPVSDPAPAAPAASDEDSVAAKLARIRAVVQTARSAPAEEDEGDSSFIEDEHAAAPASAPEAQPADLPVDEMEDAVEVAEDVTETDEPPVEQEVAAEIEETEEPVEDGVDDSVDDTAEEVDEIEASADEDIQDDYVEDTAEVEDDQPLDISALAARLSAEKEALRAEAEAEVEPEAEEIEEPVEVAFDETAQDEITEETADFTEQEMLEEIQEVPEEHPVAVLDEVAPEEVAEADADETEEVDPAQARRAERRARRAARRAQQERQPRNEGDARDAAARARARVMKVKRDELEDMRASLIESDLIPGAKADAEDAPKAEAEPVTEDAPTEEPARIRPLRVLKRARKDVEPEGEPEAEADIEADLQDEITDELDDTQIMADAEDNLDGDDLDGDEALGLSPEDEADLMAELAEVERDTAPATPVAPTEDTKAKAPAGGVTDVSRLVDEVNTKMEGTEHKRRRSAIAHLKAAVAATVAERGLGRNRDRETEAEVQRTPYRADLSAVVRPAAKPETKAKMPPLMLVSEQRIDRPKAQATQRSTGNLALRAVENDTLDDDDQDQTDDQGNIFADDDTFADFAERHGAHALPDILECAAAYLARVEGQDSFTRPEVMNTVAEFMGADKFQREDGLRAFGQLLREGPLERQGRGAFTIAATSRFMSA
ncbi:hypothetical protein [Rhodovulum sp. FJ3]|uniref:hypothetical protein n=1 Tax=Rhodovulum sp. FJ3 TaxID=3079053 RepID=UPI00293DB60F|nr:hypothetical protein [Rhodovulum sp. FJ3]MDV4166874.1 hypothetical protein [Rhodovulum sp. FJ3]